MELQWVAYLGIPLIQLSTCFQIAKIYQTRRVEGVSIIFWWMILGGLICYQVFALANWIVPYIISNALGIVLTIWYLILFYRFRRWRRWKSQRWFWLKYMGGVKNIPSTRSRDRPKPIVAVATNCGFGKKGYSSPVCNQRLNSRYGGNKRLRDRRLPPLFLWRNLKRKLKREKRWKSELKKSLNECLKNMPKFLNDSQKSRFDIF